MWASLACLAWSHGVFSTDASRGIAARWRPQVTPLDESVALLPNQDLVRRYTRATIALNSEAHPDWTVVGVCGTDADERITLYVVRVGDGADCPGRSYVTAILWPQGVQDDPSYKRAAIGELKRFMGAASMAALEGGAELELKDRRLFDGGE